MGVGKGSSSLPTPAGLHGDVREERREKRERKKKRGRGAGEGRRRLSPLSFKPSSATNDRRVNQGLSATTLTTKDRHHLIWQSRVPYPSYSLPRQRGREGSSLFLPSSIILGWSINFNLSSSMFALATTTGKRGFQPHPSIEHA